MLAFLMPSVDGFIADLDGANAEGLIEPTNNDALTPKFSPEVTFSVGGTYTATVGPGELSIFAKYSFIDEQAPTTTNIAVGKVPSQDRDA